MTGDRTGALLNALGEDGYCISDELAAALRGAPREHFISARALAVADGTGATAGTVIDRGADEQKWLEAVYSDTCIITQADDGAADVASGQGIWSSSCSAPGIACEFLELLDAQPHHRVLEIGTGTGWTAALLSQLAAHVTTIEIDGALAAAAAASLAAAGRDANVTCITGNGEHGHAAGAPYDRVHVTCGAAAIPQAWITQARPGGVIVLPWRGRYRARLTVTPDGSATGWLTGYCAYMPLRSQRPAATAWQPRHAGHARRSQTLLDPHELQDTAGPVLGLFLPPGAEIIYDTDEHGYGAFLYDSTQRDGSQASCRYRPGAPAFEVLEWGQRSLWQEAEAAFTRWVRLGTPPIERFGLTVTAAGDQAMWMDAPGNVIG